MVRTVLVVANQTLDNPRLHAAVVERVGDGATIHVVVPATRLADDEVAFLGNEGLTRWPGEEPDVAVARWRLSRAIERWSALGVEARGEVGDPDPMRAIAQTLEKLVEVEEILISTFPRGRSAWLRGDLVRRSRRRFGLPVAAIEAPAPATA